MDICRQSIHFSLRHLRGVLIVPLIAFFIRLARLLARLGCRALMFYQYLVIIWLFALFFLFQRIEIYGRGLVYLSKFIPRRRLQNQCWFCELISLWLYTIITLATVTNRQSANASLKLWVGQSLKPRTGLYHLNCKYSNFSHTSESF